MPHVQNKTEGGNAGCELDSVRQSFMGFSSNASKKIEAGGCTKFTTEAQTCQWMRQIFIPFFSSNGLLKNK